MAKIVQFISILPQQGEPHKLMHEVAIEDMPEELLDCIPPRTTMNEYSYPGGETVRVGDVACRLKVVEKE